MSNVSAAPRRRAAQLLAALACLSAATGNAQQPVAGGEMPAVSPDGRRIAFLSDRRGSNDIYLIGADGSGERQVTQGGAGSPRWSADGRELLFAGRGADSGRVFALAPESGERRAVASVPGRGPVLSPDRTRVAYLSGPWTTTAIAVADADGSGARTIAGGRTTAWNHAWSPDGSAIAYTFGDSTRQLQVHVVGPDGTGDHAVTNVDRAEGSAQMPVWSRDGRRLAVQVSHDHVAHIWVVDLATGAARKLAEHADGINDEVPAWFPDGRRIAFQSDRSGRMEIWVMDADGTHLRQVTGLGR